MPSLTSAELTALRRRDAQPTRAPGELLAIWIPGKLESRLNGPQGRTLKGARWRATKIKATRERVCAAILDGLMKGWYGSTLTARAVPIQGTPKTVRFIVYVGHEWDLDENVPAALKTHKDALKVMRIIDDDKPSSGHTFTYEQVIDPRRSGRRGVEIRVRIRHT